MTDRSPLDELPTGTDQLAATFTTPLGFLPAGARKNHKKQWILTGLGVLAGVFAVELCLYPFVASWYWPKGPIRTVRAYMEGIAESHFTADGFGTYGNRLTGNPPIAGAPTVMIVGDSHVVQDSVPDRDTVGSVVERESRAAGAPVNVKQYGWYEAGAPTYIGEGPALLKHVQPAKVVIVMNYTDFNSPVLNGRDWHMKLNKDGSAEIIDVRPPKTRDDEKFKMRDLAAISRLLVAGRRRGVRMLQAASANPNPSGKRANPYVPATAPASVRGLKSVFGDKLLIVFTPYCGGRCSEEPEPSETALLQACREQSVHCVSIRPEMLRELRGNHRIARGFHNTAPGVGHLNKVGLEIAGSVIWREIGPVGQK